MTITKQEIKTEVQKIIKEIRKSLTTMDENIQLINHPQKSEMKSVMKEMHNAVNNIKL